MAQLAAYAFAAVIAVGILIKLTPYLLAIPVGLRHWDGIANGLRVMWFILDHADGTVHANRSGTCTFVVTKSTTHGGLIRYTRDGFGPEAPIATVLVWRLTWASFLVAIQPIDVPFLGPGTTLNPAQRPTAREGIRLLRAHRDPASPIADGDALAQLAAQLAATAPQEA